MDNRTSLLGRIALLGFYSFLVLAPSAIGAARAADGKEDKKVHTMSLDEKAPGASITRGAAVQAAQKALPGQVTDITVERKRGKQVYVIEIVATKDGSENDVLVDFRTGEVLGIEQ